MVHSQIAGDDPTMEPSRTLIGVGGSAGAIEPLLELLGSLPPDLPAAVLVVIHVPPTGASRLPEIVQRATMLRVARVRGQGSLAPGHVYIAPPDNHLLADAGGTEYRLDLGPRENGSRPAIDALFRSIAIAAGPRGLGLVMSGMLDDGTVGLRAIADAGGAAFVQHPDEALTSSMPVHALEHTPAARVLRVTDMGPELTRFARRQAPEAPLTRSRTNDPTMASTLPPDSPDRNLICPDCGGPLSETDGGDGKHVSFRCVIGHAYSGASLQDAQAEVVERALWTACRALEDRASLNERLAARAGSPAAVERIRRRSRDASHAADVLRSLLYRGDVARIDAPDVADEPVVGGELEQAG